ncbi:MAG: YfiR family protein [Desulfobacterales bacterium]
MTKHAIGLIFVIIICVTLSSWTSAHSESAPDREYLIKAAFLYNFARFVNWPDDAFPDAHSPLSLCIVGKDPFLDALKTIKGKTIRGRKLEITHLARIENLEQCHMLFISASEEHRLPEILDTLREESILTVSDMSRFALRGGAIHFITVSSKIRFEINVDATDTVGLKISSKLLKLARVVHTGRRQGAH